MDACVCIVAAAEPRGVHNTADGARPDAHAFCKIVPDEIDAREEIERFTEQNECKQNAKHGEKVHGKPLLLAAEPQHDRADDEQHHESGAALGELKRDKIQRNQGSVYTAQRRVFAFYDVVDAEEHDERNVKRIVIGVCKDGVIPRTVNPLHAERTLNERDKEAIGAHEADER